MATEAVHRESHSLYQQVRRETRKNVNRRQILGKKGQEQVAYRQSDKQ